MPRCKGTNAKGEPCGVKEGVVDPETGFCPAHGPGASERMAERGRKGAKAMHARYRAGGLDPDALGDLGTVRDAQRWLRMIALGVTTGKLQPREGTTGVRAIEAWLKAEQDRVAADEVSELRAQLDEVRESLKKGRNLEVVR